MKYQHILIGLTAFLTLSVAVPVYAQFQLESYGITPDLTYMMTPDSPDADQSVDISLHSFFFDLPTADIKWVIDGNTVGEGTGMTDITTSTGDQGSEHDVVAIVTNTQGATASVNIALIPTSIDLLYDADSYVPPFYPGRALPSSGTTIHIQAVPNFVTPEGKMLSPDTLVYSWSQDGRVLKSSSGVGKSSIEVPAPFPHDATTVRVQAVSADGRMHGEASVRIPTVESSVDLYEDHPLFGIQYFSALGSPAQIPDTEMTFAVIPFFAPVHSSNDPSLQFDWTVNGTPVPLNASAPSEITIDASNSSGTAWINVAISQISNFFTDLAAQWGIQFSGDLNAATSTQNDIFHNGNQ